MYDRRYREKVLAFEASGGLLNAALVMRDRETDSWWSIITGDAIGGELAGTPLKEIPAGEKARWGDWKRRYPDTKVLSVNGREHVGRDAYDDYFTSEKGFQGLSSSDKRLPDKESIYAFQIDRVPYAVPHSVIEGGAVFDVDGRELFLYREAGVVMRASTFAYVSEIGGEGSRFARVDGKWLDKVTGEVFSKETGFPVEWTDANNSGEEEKALARLGGFDTFWYIWSTTHQNVTILE